MAIYRVYSGDDGQSHVEEMKLEDHPELTAGQDTANITFRIFPADREDEFHTAPRRQYIITVIPWGRRITSESWCPSSPRYYGDMFRRWIPAFAGKTSLTAESRTIREVAVGPLRLTKLRLPSGSPSQLP